ncbi:hypothetical protein OM076_06515 [Solirubrobacter ginsenosidimutans]|uniref:Integrase n=1 Tax=Solirubrobacter ginsenosidimutans TaxID=490573 RepID=A0A9X3MNL8_9ACTN|nr:hypothetical protein [Solirubrobacter ginsenosidimutans]MDA0159906.1 hypothetical protein [Solirubrobacter ginsenosidimutans]
MLADLVDDFLVDAPRELRAPLAHVLASDLALRDVAEIDAADVRELVEHLRSAGLSRERADAVVDALRLVFAFAVARGLVRSSPLIGIASAPSSSPSPTTVIVALGEHLVTWTVRAVVAGFVLAAIGLVVALA